MPLPGLCLMGFMDEPDALAYQQRSCIFEDATEHILRQHYQAARARLGEPMRQAGKPAILALPAKHSMYVDQLRATPLHADLIQKMGASIKRVEIAPLLAYQFQVHTVQEKTMAAGIGRGSSLRQMLEVCLPIGFENPPWKVKGEGSRMTISSPSLNLVLQSSTAPIYGGVSNTPFSWIGVPFGPASSFVVVAQFEGRCYLKNGYHRAYQLGRLGITHIPCLFVEVAKYEDAVLPGAVFPRPLLESDNPPTCGHFVHGRAYPVGLREVERVIHIDVTMDQEVVEEQSNLSSETTIPTIEWQSHHQDRVARFVHAQ
jgi:hypothetical protein